MMDCIVMNCLLIICHSHSCDYNFKSLIHVYHALGLYTVAQLGEGLGVISVFSDYDQRKFNTI